jgi:hypothetical protein
MALTYIEKEIADVLKTAPEVAALCDGRVYAVKIRQASMLPAVVYQRISSSPDYTLSGYTSEGVTLMVNCFALNYDAAKELALAVRAALAEEPLNAIFDSDRDLLNDDGNVFCISAEYFVQQSGGICR